MSDIYVVPGSGRKKQEVTLTPSSIPAGDNVIGRIKITDSGGSDIAAVEQASNWSGTGSVASLDPAVLGLTVSARNHQLWPATGLRPGIAGDGQYYGQLMNDIGDLVISLGSITSATGSIQIATGAGASTGGGVQRVAIATGGELATIITSVQLLDDVIFTDDAAFTPATSKIAMIGFQADETSTDSVDEGDAGAPRMTLDRKVIVTTQPHTAGGWDIKNCTSGDTFTALTNSAQAIKASAGQFGGYYFGNPNTSAVYINVYDVASGSVTVGTTTPKLNFWIPASSAANIEISNGIPFGTAISASATTTGGGNTAPSTALEVMFYYK